MPTATATAQESTDDIDFAEIAASLGIPGAAAPSGEPTSSEQDEDTAKAGEDPAANESDDDPKDDPDATGEEDSDKETDDKDDKGEADDQDDAEETAAKATVEPTKVQKRIDRLTAEKSELRGQLDTLKADLEEARAAAKAQPAIVHVDPENPLSAFTDAAALDTEVAKAQAVLDWADDNRDGGTVNVNGEEKYYEADDVRRIRANARAVLAAAPRQREYIARRGDAVEEARIFYPDFFKSGSQAKGFLERSAKQYPGIMRYPDWELIVGDAMAGQQLRLARAEQMQKKTRASDGAASPAASKAHEAKVPKAPASPAAAPKVAGNHSSAIRQRADAALKAPGDRAAMEAFFETIV